VNFIRSYEREMAKYTDAPEVFHTAIATNILGACLTRWKYRCLLAGGTPARWTNLWTFLVGDSAESRKSTAVNMGVEVLQRAMPELMLPNDCSPEGFAQAYVKREQRTPNDASGVMVNDELGLFLMTLQKEYMASLKGMMMMFYDVPKEYGRQLSQREFTVTRPRFSMFGGVALELLPVLTATEDWLGGFMNRTLLIYAHRTRTQERPVTVPEAVYDKLAKELQRTLLQWKANRMAQKKKLAPGVRTWLFDYDEGGLAAARALKKAQTVSLDDNVRILHGRADVHLMKMAACEQISMDPDSPTITKRAVENSAVLFTHWWKYAPDVMEMAFARSRADTEGDRLARRILRMVKSKPNGYPELELFKGTLLDWEPFNRAINSLMMGQLVERVDPGEGVVVIKLTRHAASI
jgi:hypothetical protein